VIPRRYLVQAAGGAALLAPVAVAAVPPDRFVPAPARVQQIAAALPATPAGWGAPATDRETWKRAAATIPAKELVAAAAEAARAPTPGLPDDLFRRYSRDGDRTEFQEANRRRLERLNLLAWAEAVEHKGRFRPALAREIEAILAERTWVLPAHDPKLQNFEGRWTEIDLMAAMKVFLPLLTAGLPAAPAPNVSGSHYWFADAQVYTGRAAPGFGAAIKGGHNQEHHNHNDVGSFVVARGDRAVQVDPGLEVYTARTFGPERYASQVLNSYGHAVPVVAGRLQPAGREFAARVQSTSFTAAEDRVVLDLKRAYAVPTLRSLVRTFTLRRAPRPEIVIRDAIEFTEPSAFETALVTFEKWRERKPGQLRIGEGDTALRVAIEADGAWELRPEILRENLPGKRQPHRLGLRLKEPVTAAQITVTVAPE
jgi:hypothetical protein